MLMQDPMAGRLLSLPGTGARNLVEPRPPVPGGLSRGEDPARLQKAAKEFEALFLGYMLSVMRSSIEEADSGGQGLGKGIYTELFDQELASSLAERGALGIADMLIRQLGGMPGMESPGALPPNGAAPDAAGRQPEEIPEFRMPVHAHLSSAFGDRKDPITHQLRFHRGVDIAAPSGMEVRAAAAGRVEFSGVAAGYGNTVVVRHPGGFETRYAHLQGISVKPGDWLQPGQVLGTVGSTGRSTGPHLHFEVRRYGRAMDPASLVAE